MSINDYCQFEGGSTSVNHLSFCRSVFWIPGPSTIHSHCLRCTGMELENLILQSNGSPTGTWDGAWREVKTHEYSTPVSMHLMLFSTYVKHEIGSSESIDFLISEHLSCLLNTGQDIDFKWDLIHNKMKVFFSSNSHDTVFGWETMECTHNSLILKKTLSWKWNSQDEFAHHTATKIYRYQYRVGILIAGHSNIVQGHWGHTKPQTHHSFYSILWSLTMWIKTMYQYHGQIQSFILSKKYFQHKKIEVESKRLYQHVNQKWQGVVSHRTEDPYHKVYTSLQTWGVQMKLLPQDQGMIS